MADSFYPVEQVDLDVAAIYADFLPKTIFDVHTHMYQRTAIPSFHGADRPFVRTAASTQTYELDMHPFLPGVTSICLNMMPMPDPVMSEPSNNLREEANDNIVRLIHENTGHVGCAYVLASDSEEQIAELIGNGDLRGIKCYSYGAGKEETESLAVGDYLPETAWIVANQFRLPIILHLFRPLGLSDPDNLSYVMTMSHRYPNAQLILAHCARGFAAWTSVKAIRTLVDCGNIWFDLSAICESGPMVACIMKNAGERTMWGSDYPICMTRGRAVSLATGQNWLTELRVPKTRVVAENLLAFYQAALLLELDQTQLDDLFCNNARRLFEHSVGIMK